MCTCHGSAPRPSADASSEEEGKFELAEESVELSGSQDWDLESAGLMEQPSNKLRLIKASNSCSKLARRFQVRTENSCRPLAIRRIQGHIEQKGDRHNGWQLDYLQGGNLTSHTGLQQHLLLNPALTTWVLFEQPIQFCALCVLSCVSWPIQPMDCFPELHVCLWNSVTQWLLWYWAQNLDLCKGGAFWGPIWEGGGLNKHM